MLNRMLCLRLLDCSSVCVCSAVAHRRRLQLAVEACRARQAHYAIALSCEIYCLPSHNRGQHLPSSRSDELLKLLSRCRRRRRRSLRRLIFDY